MLQRSGVLIVAAVIAFTVLTGCTSAPDRRAAADRLESDIAAMPGVEDLSVLYSNSYTHGVYLDVDVTMTQSSGVQIADVVARISEYHRSEFEEYDRSTDFTVGDRLEVSSGPDPDPERVVRAAEQLRQIGAGLPGSEISWYEARPLPRIEIDESPPAAESLHVLRQALGGTPVQLEIWPAGREPVWSVELPFGVEQERGVQRQLSELPVAGINTVRVVDGRIAALGVTIRDSKTAYADLVAVIGVTEPTREHPLNLSWVLPREDSGERRFSGRASIYGCPQSRTAGDEAPEQYYVQAAVALQQRMQNEYESCPG